MTLNQEKLQQLIEQVPADIDLQAFDPLRVPEHIAVIMDGNGRWAKLRGENRAFGHKAGIKGVRALIRTSSDLGVRYLTIYSFSTENWNRPITEVKTLMTLFANTMAAELASLDAEGVRIKTIGDMSKLPRRTRETFEDAIAKTADNQGMTLVIAVNYGARQEIVRAAQTIARKAKSGELDEVGIAALDDSGFAAYLDTAQIPDPDLLIRTSGEYRISNFLLYQIAYAEMFITPTLWPDFDEYELLRAIIAYQKRDRRFGGI
ncbi:MAG: isoprenyl transferase [Coriobacteriaceae bacterium]|nr:isoprenyl transferase [Coriobacteriaceae bacterium]